MSSSPGTLNTILEFFHLLVRKKKTIVLATAIPTIITIILVLVVDSQYKAEAVVNPPNSKGGGGLASFAGEDLGAGLLGSLLGDDKPGLNESVSLLESARLARLVIDRFDLRREYKFIEDGKTKKYYEADVLKKFRKNMGYDITDEKALRIWAKNKSPQKARDMVDYVIHVLDSLYTDLQLVENVGRMADAERRLGKAEREMKAIEDTLIAFQMKNNLLVPEAQVHLSVQNAAQTSMRLEALKEELALEAAQRGDKTARYQDLEMQRDLMQDFLDRQFHDPASANSLILPTQTLPSIAMQYFRLERQYAIKLGVFKYLVQQVEGLKLSSNQDIRVLSVVDSAWVNDKRVYPKRRAMVQAVFSLFLVLSIFTVAVNDAWRRRRKEDVHADRIAAEIRRDLFRL